MGIITGTNYVSQYSGDEIDAALTAATNAGAVDGVLEGAGDGTFSARNVDASPTMGSDALVESGGVYSAIQGKQDALTFDLVPTDGSTNPVESNGIYDALTAKQDILTFDNTPTEDSTNPVTSGGIYTAMQTLGLRIDAVEDEVEDLGDEVSVVDAHVLGLYPRTTLASAPIHAITDGADNIPIKAMSVAVRAVQSGSGDPSPSNVRPISGWTEASVVCNGINQWDEQWELGYYDNVTGATMPSTTQIRSKSTAPIPVVGGQTYACAAGSQRVSQTFWYDANDNFISNIPNSSANPFIVTAPANACYLRFNMPSAYGTTYADNVSINYPSTKTTYAPYNGHIVTIDFGGTVYGGQLTYKGGKEWEFTPTHAILDLGTLTYTKTAQNIFRAPVSNKKSGVSPLVCTQYAYTENGGFQTTDAHIGDSSTSSYLTNIFINDTAHADDTTAEFKTAMSGVMLCYELAQPLAPITLTASADTVTVYGDNVLFADCGDSTLTYRQDIGLVIGG